MTTAVAALYDAWSDHQERRLDAFPVERAVHGAALRRYLAPGSRVLDLGAGPGDYTIELARAGHRVTAGDVSPVQVEIARRRVEAAGLRPSSASQSDVPRASDAGVVESVRVLDAVDLGDLDDASFDAVVAFGPFYHLTDEEDRRAAAREVARVLRPGGRLLATFMPRTYWLSMALRSFVAESSGSAAHLDHLEAALDSGSLSGLRSPQLKHTWLCRVEAIEPLWAGVGIDTVALLASSGIAGPWSSIETWRALARHGSAVEKRVVDLLVRTATDPAILGMSDQILYVGAKR